MEPWLLFVALCSISTGYFIGSSVQTLPTNKVAEIYSGSSACYIPESEFASLRQELSSNNRTSIYVATNPRGAEGLPPDIVEPFSDLYINELLKSYRKESVVTPKYLLALTVGYNQKEIVNKMVSKFSENFTIVLFHYDGRASEWEHFDWSKRAIHISTRKQTKWWYAKRFLHPNVIAAYEYLFIWDEDVGVENFNAEEYVKLAKKYKMEISQPAVESKKGLTWLLTKRRTDVEAHKKIQECENPHWPPCAGFVEIMVPVFSSKSWSCVWRMLQNDLVHGWGLDLNLWRCVKRPNEEIGVIDAQWVEHMAVPSLGDQHSSNFAFLVKSAHDSYFYTVSSYRSELIRWMYKNLKWIYPKQSLIRDPLGDGESINGSAPWRGVRARCFSEWREFDRRLKEEKQLHSGSL